MLRKTNMIKWLFTAIIIGSICIGGTLAYLTDYDVAANEFTVGKVDIELTEPNWKPEDYKNLVPTQEIKKDPCITNTGKNDAYVYMEVAVPIQKLIVADPNGMRKDSAETKLFEYKPSEEWKLMDNYTKDGKHINIYAYTKILKPGDTSTPLFNTMTFANVIEGQVDGKTFSVPVRAYAIQTGNTGGDKGTVIEQAIHAFQMYQNQNKGQEGAVTEK